MLLRLQGTSDCPDLTEEVVLLPGSDTTPTDWTQSKQVINLVVGYNGSPKSHAALDLTLWIAHQTRLVTRKQVIVQVVYVVDNSQSSCSPDCFGLTSISPVQLSYQELKESLQPGNRPSGPVLACQPSASTASLLMPSTETQLFQRETQLFQGDPFEQADRILWQARCLADEWRGSLKAHLRFGLVATELRKIVETEAAALLCLGCYSAADLVVQQLNCDFPCPVLGIPTGALPTSI